MSDPRLVGRYTISTGSNVYGGGSARYELLSGTWRIEAEDGAWQGSYTRIGFADGSVSTVSITLMGEGGYAGLFAVWEVSYAACAWDVRGVIFPAAPPEPPSSP